MSGLFLNSWLVKLIFLLLLIYFFLDFFFIIFFIFFLFGVGTLLIFVQHSVIHSHNFCVLWESVSVGRCAFGGYQTSTD